MLCCFEQYLVAVVQYIYSMIVGGWRKRSEMESSMKIQNGDVIFQMMDLKFQTTDMKNFF